MSRLLPCAVLALSIAACDARSERAIGRQDSGSAPRATRVAGSAPSCGTAPGHELAIFVGRKRDVQRIQPEVPVGSILMDEVFRARYQVLQVLCGDLAAPEVEFEVADHYGRPAFEAYPTVLLFLSREGKEWYHEKYQYFDVYESTEGGWASCGDPYRFGDAMGRITARPVSFKEELSFPIGDLTEEQIRTRYPPAFYARQGDRVVCRAGSPVTDLVAVKREGFLKARGLFR